MLRDTELNVVWLCRFCLHTATALGIWTDRPWFVGSMGFPNAPSFLPRVLPVSARELKLISATDTFANAQHLLAEWFQPWQIGARCPICSTELGLVWLGTAPAQMIAGFQAFTLAFAVRSRCLAMK